MTTEAKLEEARANCEKYRTAMHAAKIGSKKWREAEEDLSFWQGKAANFGAMVAQEKAEVKPC